MRRTAITTALLAAGLAIVPAASQARSLDRAAAEPAAVRHVQVSAQNKAAYGLYRVTRTTHTCRRDGARRFSCNYALFVTGLIPQAKQTLCLATFTVQRTGGRIAAQQATNPTCA